MASSARANAPWSRSRRKATTRTRSSRSWAPASSSCPPGNERVTMGALDGVRVVDLSRVLAGPLCTQMLADHGADVIKVEPPMGDETRLFGPPFDEAGDAAYFTALNRGKRALSLDLSKTEARTVLDKLLADADVLV